MTHPPGRGRADDGQGLVEYGLMLGLSGLLTLALLTLGGDLVAAFLAAVAEVIGNS